jgi:hypothetical protein
MSNDDRESGLGSAQPDKTTPFPQHRGRGGGRSHTNLFAMENNMNTEITILSQIQTLIANAENNEIAD